ncbi:MAG: glycosyltransferase family 2 protein [Bacteroidia bacterium]
MEFSVIIVTYNSEEDIINCIKSITLFRLKYSIEIIIVDNHSTDNTLKLIQNNFKDIILLKLKNNLGYAKAANIGSTHSSGQYLIFCNPDVIITDDIFLMSQKHLIDTNIGCISPAIKTISGIEEFYAFKFPQRKNILIILLKKLFNYSTKAELQINTNETNNIIKCDWVLGACLIISSNIFNGVGKFDESYFLNYEEIDLCRKLKNKFIVIADRNYSVVHIGHQSKKKINKAKLLWIRVKSEYYFHNKKLF